MIRSVKKPLSRKSVEKQREREASVGIDAEDDAAKWLEEHDPKPPPQAPKAASKSKALHQWRQQQQRRGKS
jgi:hypothetical protein